MNAEARSFGAPATPVRALGHASRVGVIADVHGNALALAAVLVDIRRDPPELVVVNGDLTWGPEPGAVLALADELPNAVFVRGNAESALLRLARTPSAKRSETETWMLERHDAEQLERLAGFAGAVVVEVEGLGRVFVCHGSPRGDQEVVTPETPERRMGALLAGTHLDVLVTAHVHLQFQRRICGVTSMNPGSVGLQYGGVPAAYWAELGSGIRLRQSLYDLDEADRRIRESGIPSAERLLGLLRRPPSAREVIDHGEQVEVSD